MIDIPRRHRMIEAFMETHGEETAMTLAESLYSGDHATKADLEPLATKADLERFPTKADLKTYATKTDLERFPTKADLKAYATKTDLEVVVARLSGQIDASATSQMKWFIATMIAFLGFILAAAAIATTILVQAINAAP